MAREALVLASGKPVDARVSAARSRQDALLADAVRAAEQRGFSVELFRIEALKSNPALEAARLAEAARAGKPVSAGCSGTAGHAGCGPRRECQPA